MQLLTVLLVFLAAAFSYAAGVKQFQPYWINYLQATITVMALFISIAGSLHRSCKRDPSRAKSGGR